MSPLAATALLACLALTSTYAADPLQAFPPAGVEVRYRLWRAEPESHPARADCAASGTVTPAEP